MRAALALPLGWLALGACGEPPPAVAPDPRGLSFADATAEAGLDAFQQVNGDPDKGWITDSVGGGVALFDHGADGDLDAYLTNGSRLGGFPPGAEPRDALFVQEGGRFADRTLELGLGDTRWTMGVRVCDVDGDGRSDLFLTNNGPNALYRDSGARFEDVAQDLGLDEPAWSTGAAFLDLERDGDLDLYVATYLALDLQELHAEKPQQSYRGVSVFFGPRGLPAGADRFYVQQADGRFVEAGARLGIASAQAYGMGVVVFDHDEDGWIDVYVANDSMPNFLWRNLQGERFEDVAMFTGTALSLDGTPQAGMGIALGDFDLDLEVDLYVTNFAEDYFTLYRGEGGGLFRDVTTRYDLRVVTMPLLGWSTGFADFDLDGDSDLYTVNGHVFPQVDAFDIGTSYRQHGLLLENVSGRLVPTPGGGGECFRLPRASRGSAVGDWDGDGRLDLLVGNIDGPPALLRNTSEGHGHWLGVRLVGRGKNRDAIGARVVAHVGGRRELRLCGSADGFCSSSDQRLWFGLGAALAAERLEVRWPDGTSASFADVRGDRCVTIDAERGLLADE